MTNTDFLSGAVWAFGCIALGGLIATLYWLRPERPKELAQHNSTPPTPTDYTQWEDEMWGTTGSRHLESPSSLPEGR